jgi:ubiquinone/menaquinone biosynthesis C-methylase UbiE
MEVVSSYPKRRPSIDSQFGRPTGLVGVLVGNLMAIEHRALHRAVVDRLSLSSDDSVLEIGFGPGTAIRRASRQASFVAGIDVSKEMVQQAKRRNRFAMRSGRVELLRASVASIPFPNDHFSVVFEVNTFHHWEDPEGAIREVHRVLQTGGRFLAVLRKEHHGSLRSDVERVSELLLRQGFLRITSEEHHFGHGGAFVEAHR